jgi:(p)ppGpp synthase/HD superfamily hydrolase
MGILGDRMTTPYQFAAYKHNGQKRKFFDEDYIDHPVLVRDLVGIETISWYMVTAAILHDTIGDTDTTHEELTHKFGKQPAYIVLELTNVYTKEAYPDMNRRDRKKAEHDRLSKVSDDAKLIKLADRIANLLDFKRSGCVPKYYLDESRELYKLIKLDSTKYLNLIMESLMNDYC